MITGFVRGQDLRLAQTIVAAEEGYATARFIFQTGEWLAEGVTVYAHFKRDSDGGQTDAAVVDGCISVAAELTLDAGAWTVWLTGHRYEDGALVQRLTTDTETLTVKPAGFTAAEPLPVRSFGESILGEVQEIYRDVAGQLQAAATATDEQLAEQDEKITAQLEAQLEAQDAATEAQLEAQDTKVTNQLSAQNTAVSNQLSTQNTAVSQQLTSQNTAVQNQLSVQNTAVNRQLAAQNEAVDARLDENEAIIDAAFGGLKNWRDGKWLKLWAGTESQYEAASKSADTIYLIDLGLEGGPAPAGGGGD